ncbi:hypothetical protein EVAR_53483_1 [Eumeta japonica]|uniref:Uncharacterized protein n=1 Tax=Eumeta variegata TaxID=151549 RepID=A0A4C1YV19_EUMVA|nr:hypothetical protein EVAR_53483_1 [Eumeta japonica]
MLSNNQPSSSNLKDSPPLNRTVEPERNAADEGELTLECTKSRNGCATAALHNKRNRNNTEHGIDFLGSLYMANFVSIDVFIDRCASTHRASKTYDYTGGSLDEIALRPRTGANGDVSVGNIETGKYDEKYDALRQRMAPGDPERARETARSSAGAAGVDVTRLFFCMRGFL